MTIHPRTPERFRAMPKFLIADSGGEREQAVRYFVLHCHYPRFLLEFDDHAGTHQATWIDDPAPYLDAEIMERRNPNALDELIAAAVNWRTTKNEDPDRRGF